MKKAIRLISLVTVFTLLINMLPLTALAEELKEAQSSTNSVGSAAAEQIAEELPGKRTEYSKQFRLADGTYMAAVYPDAIHYETENGWEEIDNTLTLRSDGTYSNTAGVWDVRFPQQLTGAKSVSITKDGYTLSFAMAGELRSSGNLSTASIAEIGGTESLAVSQMQISSAQIQSVNTAALQESLEHSEIVPEKLRSRLMYTNVYADTNVVYDLDSNRVKESIILGQYSSTLRGYRYTLNVGQLIPVLDDNGQITFYTPDRETAVMVMPAPFLVDDALKYSYDVQVQLTGSGSTYTLTYLLPRQWLASSDRAWPVVLDPVVTADVAATNILDRRISENTTFAYNHHLLEAGYDDTYGKTRSYLQFVELPTLTSADVVVDASIHLYQPTERADTSMSFCVEVRKVGAPWHSQEITWANQPALSPAIEDYCMVSGTEGYYGWEITDVVRSWYDEGNYGLVFKSTDATEAAGVDSWMQFLSSDAGFNKPILTIAFRNNNGLESYWDYTSSSAGRAGTGYVNNYTGNLVWVREDIGFGGYRMPVTVNHVYNANDIQNYDADSESNNNANDTAGDFFGMGHGWRTNFSQRLYQWTTNSGYYVWEDADGTDHYFAADANSVLRDEDGLELTLTVGDDGTQKYCITDKYGNASYFDTYGRLTKQENNQRTKSSINITYTTDTGPLIATVTDGVDRAYNFTYTDGLLTRISYTGTGTTEVSYVSFGYTGEQLTTVTDPDGKVCIYTYSGNLLTSAQDVDGYRLTYSYNTVSAAWQPYRVQRICEYDGDAPGGELTIGYVHNQTTFTDHNGNVEILQFNDFGNTVSVQDDEGRAQYAHYAFNTAEEVSANTDTTKKGNQLRLSSKLQNTVGNYIRESSFETDAPWYPTANVTMSRTAEATYHGNYSLKLVSTAAGSDYGACSHTFYVAPGETMTLSAYVKTVDATAELALHSYQEETGVLIQRSDTIPASQDWTRIQVTLTNTKEQTVPMWAYLFLLTPGAAYIDGVQVERSAAASRHNLIENGDFRYGEYGWSRGTGLGAGDTYVSDTAAAPELDSTVYKLHGDPAAAKQLTQQVYVSGNAGDSFVLAGWAKGNSVPLTGEFREFALTATFHYTDGTASAAMPVRFNTDVENWQYAAAPIVAEKAYSSLTVSLVYAQNANTVCFDGVQLFKEIFGSSYAYDDNGNVISVADLQGTTTVYEYTNNNLTRQLLPDGTEATYTYDSYHNLSSITTDLGKTFGFGYDEYGNRTSVATRDYDGLIRVIATYTDDGNRLLATVDALGNNTGYIYNADTNVLQRVRYPESNWTDYTYDQMYRLLTATSADYMSTTPLTASYSYTDDLLTGIQTGSTAYTFAYGDFALRQSVSIGSRTLASYTYTDDRNYYLSSLDYGNGDKVQYTYDDKGRVTLETYEDGATVSYQYDNDGALATVTDSTTGIETSYYYDFTDRLMKYVETGEDRNHSVAYSYDIRNNLSAMVETINGVEHTTSYAYLEDNRVLSLSNGESQKTITYVPFNNYVNNYALPQGSETSHNGTQLFHDVLVYTLRDERASTQIAGKYVYLPGAQYAFAGNGYIYDGNGNITRQDTVRGIIGYTYDGNNQLIEENNRVSQKKTVWTYDDAGNILSRTEYPTTGATSTPTDAVTYSYTDSEWGDLLTGYDGRTFTYDTIGNLLSDGIRIYTWQHGRQLASISDGTTTWTYTYDANGMRTQRANGTDTYRYIYNGSHLTGMTKGSDTLYFSYDADGHPFTLIHNGTTYYYIVSPYGTVDGILDSTGTLAVYYDYDAWGNLVGTGGTMADTLGVLNPLRYRSYVYDNETDLYYLQSRYYDPETGRFITSDVFASTGQGLSGNNMFAYCGNNPVTRTDPDGKAWETVWDVASLVGSIADVVLNPSDAWAWAGLAGDIADVVIPFVGGLGEAVRAVNVVADIAETVDDAHDISRAIDNASDLSSAVKIHGNSLRTTKETIGYALRQNGTGEIMKYGETTRGVKRYSNKFYRENNVYMEIIERGSKRDMHFWQHNKILEYYDLYGKKPPMNKSFW